VIAGSSLRRPAALAASLLGLLGLAACAGPGQGAARGPVRPADAPLAADTALSPGNTDAAFSQAWEGVKRGDAARDAGRADEARAEWTRAADGFLAAGDAHPEWRLALGLRAAELYHRAGADDRAAEVAGRVARDPAADDRSRALGHRQEAQALWELGQAQAKAGKLPALNLAFADERAGRPPPAPQPVPGTWKRCVEAVDALLALPPAEAEAAPPAGVPPPPGPARLALDAARISFAFDDLADARKRLSVLLERWPEDEAAAEAIPLYLQTFLVAGDREGFQGAAARLGERYGADAARGKEGLARGAEALKKTLSDADFSAAQKLLEAGKPAEAAQAYEAIAARGDPTDAPGALHNAAIAWDRAGEPARAAAARERILQERPESRVAPTNALMLAAYQSRKGDHAAAARAYADFLERWPDHASRCIAMQNVAAELDAARRGSDAAERYLAFGKDAACARIDPAVAATALRRARTLFDAAGKPARAKEAADAAAALVRKPAKEKAP
jgi:hypothetical protein